MQDGAFSLTAPPVQDAGTDCPAHLARGDNRLLSISPRHRTKPAMKCVLNPYGAAGPQSPERHLPESDGAANRRKILRERHQMRGQDFVFNLKSEYPSREQVMQYGEDDPDVCLTPAVGSGYLVPLCHRRPAENRSCRVL